MNRNGQLLITSETRAMTADPEQPAPVPPGRLLTTLRAAAPERRIGFDDALALAERQAALLRDGIGTDGPRLAHEPLAALPRLRVEVDSSLPVSASAHWDSHSWVITLNANDTLPQRRWSLIHEIKHIVDHPQRRRLYGPVGDAAAAEAAERAADHFAAAALMPAKWVLWLHRSGVTEPAALAERFQVTTGAARYRLSHLGLIGRYYHRPHRPHQPSRPTRRDRGRRDERTTT